MKKAFHIVTLFFLVLFTGCSATISDSDTSFNATSFTQPISVKYTLDANLVGSTLKKVVVDYNGIAYVLTDVGVGRAFDGEIIKDLRYRPLIHHVPVDITIQGGTGYLYYLYDHYFLSNAYAGKPYGSLPKGKYNKIAVAADGTVLLSGEDELSIYKDGELSSIPVPIDHVISIKVYDGIFYVLSPDAIYQISGNELNLLHEGNGLQTFTFLSDDIILGTSEGYYSINSNTGDTSLSLQSRVPIQDVQELITVDGKLWAGTDDGVFMRQSPGEYSYYASKRWLNEDSVISMASDSKGNVYLLTATGLNEIRFIQQTYLKKAKYFQNKIRKRHIRYGLLAQIVMKTPGDLSTAMMVDTDNDGLWTAFYLGSQAFQYAVTKDPKARRYAWESFAAYERLLSINQLKGFPARTFVKEGVKVSSPRKWRPSHVPGWKWKGTTSSDEFVGYIFVAALMDEFVAETREEKRRVADFIDKILTHIIENNYSFVDVDGTPTLWARWNPKYRNWYPKTIMDRKLGSTTIIAGLQLGYFLTGKEIYKKEALRLMNEHGYLENIMISVNNIEYTAGYVHKGRVLGTEWNHSDDEMAFLDYWVLYHYALNDELKQKYASVIKDHWEIELPEKHPVWNLITLATEGSFDKASTLWYLREFPMDLIRWNIENSQRKDLTFLEPNFRGQYTKEVLSPAERPAHRYNANEFVLDGGEGGRTELTGAEYLLAYWMGRYLGIFETINKK